MSGATFTHQAKDIWPSRKASLRRLKSKIRLPPTERDEPENFLRGFTPVPDFNMVGVMRRGNGGRGAGGGWSKRLRLKVVRAMREFKGRLW